jgi:hypothetical protein
MINKKSINHITNHRITPSENSWLKLKQKLDKRVAKRKITFYRNLSFAAGIIALVCFTYMVSEKLPLDKKKTFATNHLYKPAILEELPKVLEDPFYSQKKLIHYNESGYTFP